MAENKLGAADYIELFTRHIPSFFNVLVIYD